MFETMKLGRKPKREDIRTLRLRKYIAALPAAPPACSFQAKVPSWPMFLNDQLGDCVIAAAAHAIQQWTEYSGNPIIPTDAEVLAAYEAIGGYVMGNPSTDQGCDMLTALTAWRQSEICGRKIAAFVALTPGSIEELKLAISLFGNAYIGLALPISAQQDTNCWDVAGSLAAPADQPGSWGGHCTILVEYTPECFVTVTWGRTLMVTPKFCTDYIDEAYAILTEDWLDQKQRSPGGFDLAQLQADLAEIAQS